MKTEVKVPAVGESVTEATVSQILKPSGSFVNKEEEILELETDKVNQVIYAPDSGVIEFQVKVNDKVTIGQVIGFIDTDQKSSFATKPSSKPASEKPLSAPLVAPTEKKEQNSPLQASSGARVFDDEFLSAKMQESKSISPKVTQEAPKIAPQEGQQRKRMSGLRRTIAQKLVEVKNTTAMLTTFNEVDMSKIMEIREKQKENFEKKHGVKLGFLSFFVTAASSALKAFPEVNAMIDGEDIVYNKAHHIGIAVSTDKGLMVPVLRNCEKLSFAKIESDVASFAKKAREGSISIEDLQGGTFTITNGGTFGSLLSTPIMNPPQSAILGMHKIMKRPVVVEDQIVIRPMMYVALSYDHRIIDGKEAVSFLVHLKEHLEEPSKFLLD